MGRTCWHRPFDKVSHIDTHSILSPKLPRQSIDQWLSIFIFLSVLVSGLPCCGPALGCYSLVLRGFLPISLLQDLSRLACKVSYSCSYQVGWYKSVIGWVFCEPPFFHTAREQKVLKENGGLHLRPIYMYSSSLFCRLFCCSFNGSNADQWKCANPVKVRSSQEVLHLCLQYLLYFALYNNGLYVFQCTRLSPKEKGTRRLFYVVLATFHVDLRPSIAIPVAIAVLKAATLACQHS